MTLSNGSTENAQLYATSPAHRDTSDLEGALEHLGDPDGWEVLDVATGTGHAAFFFSRKQAHVFAIDIRQEMLEVAQEEADRLSLSCRFLKGSAEDLPFDDESFDLLTCRLAAHHFSDLDRFLQEARRVLRPDGRLLLIDNIVPAGSVGRWINDFEQRRDPSHVAYLSKDAWGQLLAKHGFRPLHSQELPHQLNFDLWMDRMSVNAPDKDEAWEKLKAAPSEVQEFLQPSHDKNRTLTLHRLVTLVGRD